MLNLDLTHEQERLKDAARTMLAAKCPPALVRDAEAGSGFAPQLWREMAALDWLGLGIQESAGGSGGGLIELFVLATEIGRALAPVPFVASVTAGQVLAGAGPLGDLRDRMVAGSTVVVPAVWADSAERDIAELGVSATPSVEGHRLTGRKLGVDWAPCADQLLVPAHVEGTRQPSVFVVASSADGVDLEPVANLADQPAADITFADVTVPSDGVVANGWGRLRQALDWGLVLQCAEIVGLAERALDIAVGYACERQQFDRPIGEFQAVQYLCTDIAIAAHTASLHARRAARLVADGGDGAPELAMAAVTAARAAEVSVRQAHEVLAGLAFMLECDLQLFTRRALQRRMALGDIAELRQTVAADLAEPEMAPDPTAV